MAAAHHDPHGGMCMSSFWDQNYSQAEGYKYGETPNAFLVQEAHRLARPGCVLVPGDGEGRNGVWLAEQGFEVHTLDGSGVGVAKARALAERRGVSLDALQVDLAEWEPAPAGF
ncbi:MAG: class I SAM-dependent methyltransferase, partial [Brachymonas sp.]